MNTVDVTDVETHDVLRVMQEWTEVTEYFADANPVTHLFDIPVALMPQSLREYVVGRVVREKSLVFDRAEYEVPHWVLREIAARDDEDRFLVVLEPNAPADVLDRVDVTPTASNVHWRKAVAEHQNASEAALYTLSTDPDRWVRQRVAAHPGTPLPALGVLARDRSPKVREGAAGNPRTSVDVLTDLSTDSCHEVRLAVWQNSATPEGLLAQRPASDDMSVF